MTNSIDFILTTAANEIIFKVLSGKTLNFTRMAVGDGFSYDTTVAKGYTTIVNEVLSLDITKVETNSLSSVRVTSVFKNTDAEKEFYYREVGLYAQDPDTGKEILYAYGNRNDAAELITPTGSSVITKQLNFIISVGDSANVTFNVNAGVYALQEDLTTLQANLHELNSTKADKTQISSPYNYKGACTSAELASKTGMVINDTWYITDLKVKKSWNGTSWGQSSLNEADYQENLSKLSDDINGIKNYNNALVFPHKIFNTDVIISESIENTSLIRFAANGQLASQKTFNVLADNPFYLKPNTTYTLSTNPICGEALSATAFRFKMCRRDTYEEVCAVYDNVLRLQNAITFTTPDTDSYYFVCIFGSTTNMLDFDVTINVNITEGTSANYKQYGIDIKAELPTIKRLMANNANILVAKDGSGDYTTLTEAVENAKDFDVIYVKNGIYENEIVKAWLKTVFIIGESRDDVVIKNNTGAYATPPIEMGTGLLKNLTVYAENDGTTSPANKGYALHSESTVFNYHNFAIENCNIRSDWRSSWGIGMRGGMTYNIRNTNFDGVYLHDSEHSSASGEQIIFFDNCNIVRNNDDASLILQDQNMSGSSIDVRFNRCFIKSKLGSDIKYYLWDSVNNTTITKTSLEDFLNWTLNDFSWGNNKEELNFK